MKNGLRYGTVLLAMISSASVAAAQVGTPGERDRLPGSQATNPAQPSQLQLSPAQKSAIFTAVRDSRINPPVIGFTLSVGAQVPPSVELHAMPIAALSQAPEVQNMKYTMVQNQVVLVDPATMRVVDIIRQ
jgi:hypothetical protein